MADRTAEARRVLTGPLRRTLDAPQARQLRMRLQRGLEAVRNRVRPHIDLRSSEGFVADAYRLVFHREADPSGLAHYAALLRHGVSRDELLVKLALSEESMNRVQAESFVIQNLRELRPDHYEEVTAVDGTPVPVFVARDAADYDWMERCILEYDYYEKPGIWTLGIDADKRRMAEMLSHLQPRRALEIGCSSGAVLSCLRDRGVDAEGVEISASAIRRAEPAVRERIHRGDPLSLELDGRYDLVYGLDVFEHFNPNRLDAYIARVADLTDANGFVFANVPTYGADRVYGTIWNPHLPVWQEDIRERRLFRHLEVDRDGYPLHGHLVWAGSEWWEARFAAAGLRRRPEMERALHERFDADLQATPARRAFFIFSRDGEASRAA
jgi:SAM-dependent methyltransferase